jgi:hypothetical protein
MRFLLLLFLIVIPPAFARAEDTLPKRYLDVYLKINDAEHEERVNDYTAALETFQDCYRMLSAIHDSDPAWESALVIHRLEDCKTKILDLEPKAVATMTSSGTTNQLRPSQIYEKKVTADSKADFQFAPDARPAKSKSYPWKVGILTTIFWIGEDSSHASAWNEQWTKSNHGADDPDNRNGFATADHASSVNPFYVALPFNDLAHPDKARNWVPRSWQRPSVHGRPVSACKDRWVCIKNADGRLCYAQWEDVGPDGNAHAEYVFGTDSPVGAGLDISPAVAQYLTIESTNKPLTSWRFVDDQDVPPGQWLKYDEQAVIYTALHQEQKAVP